MKAFFESDPFLERLTSVIIDLIFILSLFWITSEQWETNKHDSDCEGAVNKYFECDCTFQNDFFGIHNKETIMIAIITNKHTKERKFVRLSKSHVGSNPNQIALEQVADRIIKRIANTYPKAYKVIHISKNRISIMSGNATGCIFEIQMVEKLKDCDDSFFG